jgi:hypothetical protein
MTDLTELLQDDFHEILALIATWAADPRGSSARTHFNAVTEGLTMHARFVDMAVAPLVPPISGISGSAQVIRNHRPVMDLLGNLTYAADHGQAWSVHLVILTEIVCPHLILHDQLMLTHLRRTLPLSELDGLGRLFLDLKNEHPLAARRAGGIRPVEQEEGPPRPTRRPPGRYPAHHPDPATPWPLRTRNRRQPRTGPGLHRPGPGRHPR